jgi:putative ABC transport system permease protein
MSLIRRLFNAARDERLSRDIGREMEFHIREHADALMARGVSERDAMLAARRRFGNATYQSERTRDADIIAWVDSVKADIRYAMRALRRAPAFTAVAVLSLGLGIGANTAIYSLLDAVVLRSLNVPHPDELVILTLSDTKSSAYFTNPLWEQVRDNATGFTAIAAFGETPFNTAEGGEVRRVRGQWVSGDYFRVFAVQAALGRVLAPGDDVRGCPATAVLGYDFWQSEYGGRGDIVGASLSLEGKPFQIVGVASSSFGGPEVGYVPQVYTPICAQAIMTSQAQLAARSRWWLRVIGRRDPNLTLVALRARLKSLAPTLYAATVPPDWSAEGKIDYQKRTMNVFPAPEGVSAVRERYTMALKVMMGAVTLLLLITCANVANLLLARAATRQREVAIRLAIGAARARLVRQLLTESALLALVGAIAGLFVARWGTTALVSLISTNASPVSLDLALNVRVLAFTAFIAAVTVAIFGLVPAWRGTRVSPQVAMKAGGRGLAEGHSRFTVGKSLVVAQVALSLTLIVGAGLLVGSLRNLRGMDPGFTSEGVLMVNANFRRTGLEGDTRRAAQREALDRIRALPGVRLAASADLTPVGGSSWNDFLYVDGFTPTSTEDGLVWFNEVGDEYFATLDIRLIVGRDFDRTDVPNGPRTAILSHSLATKFFGDTSAVGRRFRTKRGDTFSDYYTVVGVVEDAKYRSLRETNSGTVYLPGSQNTEGAPYMNIVMRADGNSLPLVPAVKRAIAAVHRGITLEITTMDAQLAASLSRERMLAVLSAIFGSVALALSMLGLYGVMTYTVARRRNELGVRIALGADGARLLQMVLLDVARVALIGLVLGAAGALAAGRLLDAFLFGLEPADPAVLGGASALLLAVALLAGLLPALRASRADPVAALRED